MSDDLRSWFPLYVADILTSRMIRGFDAEKFGIFMFLLIEQWDGGPLPEDKSALCDMAKCDSWPKVEAILQVGFVLHDQGWVNERLVEIWVEQDARRKNKSRAGKKGAEARWGKKPKLLGPPKDPVDTKEDGNRIPPANGSDDAEAVRPQSDPNGNESRGKESIEEKESKPKKNPDPVRQKFRDDMLYLREGLKYGADVIEGQDIIRGYRQIPMKDFLDYQKFCGHQNPLPTPAVFDTDEQFETWYEGGTDGDH